MELEDGKETYETHAELGLIFEETQKPSRDTEIISTDLDNQLATPAVGPK